MTRRRARSEELTAPGKIGPPARPVSGTEPPTVIKTKLRPGETAGSGTARLLVEGVTINAALMCRFSQYVVGVEATEVAARLAAAATEVARGDPQSQETMLAAQTVALNAVFVELSMLAREHLTGPAEFFERLMRLALRAQNQSRATAETLALMQNPPVFARQFQANITQGPQQVNNGRLPDHTRAETEGAPIELLEAHGEYLDPGTPRAASASDSPLAPVDPVHGATERRRKGPRGA